MLEAEDMLTDFTRALNKCQLLAHVRHFSSAVNLNMANEVLAKVRSGSMYVNPVDIRVRICS